MAKMEPISQTAVNFKDPVLVRIAEVAKDYEISAPKTFAKDSVYWIFEKQQQERALLRAKDGSVLSVSFDSPAKFQVVFRYSVGPPTTLKEILKHSRSSSDVTVTISNNPRLLFSNRPDLSNPVAYGELKLLSTVEEMCLLGHLVNDQTLDPNVVVLSIRAPISLEILKSWKGKTSTQFRQWTDSLLQLSTKHGAGKTAEPLTSISSFVLLKACVGENVTRSDHTCFLYPANRDAIESKVTHSALPRLALTLSDPGGETGATGPPADAAPGEIVDIRALKSKFEQKNTKDPNPSPSKPSSPGSRGTGSTEKKNERSERGSGVGQSAPRACSHSGETLLGEASEKKVDRSASDVRATDRRTLTPWIKRSEEIHPIANQRKETPCFRSRSQDNLLDVSGSRLDLGSGVSSKVKNPSVSFKHRTLASKSSPKELAHDLHLTRKLAESSSDDDNAYEDVDDMFPGGGKVVSTAHTKSTEELSKVTKSRNPFKRNLGRKKLPLPPPPPVESNTRKVPESTTQTGYLQILSTDNDTGCSYATLRDREVENSRATIDFTADSFIRSSIKDWKRFKDVGEIPRDVDVETLTLEEVGHCLRLLKMKKYAKKFKRRFVDGAVLVTLTETMLVESFKMDRLDARKIVMFARDNWRPSKK